MSDLTPFEEAVVAVLGSLGPGDVVTYGEVAAEAGYPGRARPSAASWLPATWTCRGGGWSPPPDVWSPATRSSTPGGSGPRASRSRTDTCGPRGHRNSRCLSAVQRSDSRRWQLPPISTPAATATPRRGRSTTPRPWPGGGTWRTFGPGSWPRCPGSPPRDGGRPAAACSPSPRRLGAAVALWALRERRSDAPEVRRAGISRRLRVAAERLGPTYIKLGQIISAGEGIFPAELVNEFKLCRDQVPAEPFQVVRQVIEEDLGRPLQDTFRWVDRSPLAAASIAQVHAATLRTGESVVVKVQRPAVARLVRDDLRVMAWLAPKLVGRIPVTALANPPALVELFAQTIAEELDFRLEAENMVDLARTFAELGQRGYVVPRPHPELVTRRVLVMERLDGFRFDDVVGMRDAGVDTEAVIRTGMIATLEGAILKGIFHGDLHGGNLFVQPDGRTALLGLRHHRTSRRAPAPGVPAAAHGRSRQRRPGAAGRAARPGCAAARRRPRGRGARSPPRPTTRRPHDHVGRAAGGRDPAGDEGAARYRRPLPQGADAVREEPRVPRRGHRPAGARPRHLRRRSPASRSTSPPTTATASPPTWASTLGPSSSTWPA